ncbi:hypothetical protein AB4516_22765 [Vibrio sp. 10N.222.54.F12]|uniref:hypothetical protein n=1 Tax=Vibrio TaxID=662 RepID=UPI000C868024|nr:hypothetical protein [Vibrio tasmaniensis]PML18804.1 hypothetical protein BCT83_22180 [Vibrio tasmaniensis]PML52010.1 hypothetical protein BCT76_22610 [Vibrio tasmaniensis]
MSESRLREVIDISARALYEKMNGGAIVVENEASMQLHLSSILKSIGEIYVNTRDEIFGIELEKPVSLEQGAFVKSGSNKAKVDIYIYFENLVSGLKSSCAIELKFFKKSNHREPNNRYDVFKDIHNLENYSTFSDFGVMLVGTDHRHYIDHDSYSKETGDFDFRNGSTYTQGTELIYYPKAGKQPYGSPITLSQNYEFQWWLPKSKVGLLFLEI